MNNAAPQAAGANPLVFGAAILGRRSEQQDTFRSAWLADEEAWLLVVADGMGGQPAGNIASRIAADAFVATFTARRAEGVTLERSLQSALRSANSEIARGQQDVPETRGMGTTLAAAHISADGLAWISVGDSPMWLFRRGDIERVNDDHSFRRGDADHAGVAADTLQSFLNGQKIALIDCQAKPIPMRIGDFVVLASDGLLTLSEPEIARAVREGGGKGAAAVARTLLKAVEDHRKSDQDNCTVLVAAPYGNGMETTPETTLIGYRWIAVIAVAMAVLAAGIGYYIWRRWL